MDEYVDTGEAAEVERIAACRARLATRRVAVVGAGLAGLMAARTLARWGAKAIVFEARAQVGGRVLSDSTFAKGRITEAGAELIGSIHTRWCALAKEYGISLISRMTEDLYRGQQLQQRVILDRHLSGDEAAALDKERNDRVLRPMAEFAQRTIRRSLEQHPWDQPDLLKHDRTSVAEALETQFGVRRSERLWKAMELFLVNDNVSALDHMSYLALLCLVRGGQTGLTGSGRPVTIGDPLMGYWNELEIYRCGDGCQRLALDIAAEVNSHKGSAVVRTMGVRRIDLRPAGGGVQVTARSTKDTPFERWVREKVPNPLTETLRFDAVVFAVPPPAWADIEIIPSHPKDVIGLMGWGPAVKFFSNVSKRFWIDDGFSPMGGSTRIGQVWEGTDNQTRVKGQDTVLSVYTGARTPTEADYISGLDDLYPAIAGFKGSGYRANLRRKLLVDWSRQPFIRTGNSSPRVGQVFTIGKELNETFQGRLVFAGEHTQLDHFGYMEGAIRSGERAARQLLDIFCPLPAPPPEPARVAASGRSAGAAMHG